ncbi:AraC family transcriptional regulator [Streptomyces globosus]|jgi:AraC-like DNA-binding protein|uniref:helix-turn-helix transcriptional regulator n=1 Tax=Streptomyces TaxID=1883 RepID=UPI00163C2B2D|nr:AraC family transcriptional regulator [Streptomyces sp. WAC05292]
MTPTGRSAAELPLHRLQVPQPHLLPFAVGSFDAIGPLSRAGFPHRHTFHEIAHVTGGSGEHVLDLVPGPLAPPLLCVITPGQVHHWEGAEGLTGRVVLFHEDFLGGHPEDARALRRLAGRPTVPLGAHAPRVAGLADAMEEEYRALRPGYAGVLRAYLHILVVEAARAAEAVPPPAVPADRADGLAEAFGRITARPGGAQLTVAACARELGVSTGHLHAAVKQATGLTPGELIRRAQTLEAKRLLAGTDMTVRQVAHQAGFTDPSYFCRFFRRETGLTPGGFRAGLAGKHHDPRITSIAAPESGP